MQQLHSKGPYDFRDAENAYGIAESSDKNKIHIEFVKFLMKKKSRSVHF